MNERPRVLLVNYEFPPIGGGAGTATAGIARALAALGCDPVVLTSRFRGQPALEHVDGYTIRRARVVRRHADRCTPAEMLTFITGASWSAMRLTREWRPHLTIAFFGIPGGPVAWLVRALRGTPYIVSLRGGDVPGFNWSPISSTYHRLTAPVLRRLWRRAAAVVANGSGLRDLAMSAAPGLDVPVVPNGVDAVRHAPGSPRSGTGTPRLLLVGRLVHQKAIDVLLHALARMADCEFRCDIVGDGPDRSELEQLSRSLGLDARVHFRGWVGRDELPDVYQAADIFVLPSRIEGMPNVVLEAMAYALPVTATDVPGTRDLVQHDVTGLLVPVNDVAGLAAALLRLIREPALRIRMGDAGRARVLAEFTYARVAAAYLRLGGIMLPAGENPPVPGGR